MLSKHEAFFAHVRKHLFGGKLNQGQVEGINRLLSVWDQYMRGPRDELAYNLATSFHETAHTMQPIKERGQKAYFNKYEPGTKLGKILGNIKPGDGYRYRGEGDVQNTGRANAAKATKRLNELFGLGVDLVANPALRGDPKISALSLFIGNREGWWTGKDLGDYLDGVDEADDEDLREFVEARRVVNGTDKAKLIAGYALAFDKALEAGGYIAASAALTGVEDFPDPIEPVVVQDDAGKTAKPLPPWLWPLITIITLGLAAAGLFFVRF